MSEAHVAETRGLNGLDEGFARDVQEISALALFAKALPGWCAANGKGVRITVQCGGPDVSVDIGLSAGATAEQAEDLLRCLRDWERLQVLELLVDQLRGAGVSVAILDPMIAEAERLALKLAPPTDDDD